MNEARERCLLVDCIRCSGAKAKERALRPVSLRLPVADIERAKVIAAQKGIGYQTVLKEAIRNGLAKSA